MAVASELAIDTTATALQMADTMFGEGVTVVSATYTGAVTASGIYTGADTTMPGVAPEDSGVILSTGAVTSITNTSGEANISAGTSTAQGTAGDAQLTAIAGLQTFDAAVLQADFIPVGDTLTMQLVFSSEEYLEYVNSGFNDAVGIWINGVQASLTFGDGNISIDNINNTNNSNLYIDNPTGASVVNTEMDGLTVTLTVKAPVNPGVVNTLKIGIADAGDSSYDSNLMIVANSLQTELIANDDTFSIYPSSEKTVDLRANDESQPATTIKITHLNGQPVNPGDSVVLVTGETLTLNADSTVSISAGAATGTTVFSYTITDGVSTDVAYVSMSTAACFTAGTLIETPSGPVRIETLRAGDLVLTRDEGAQPLRWIGFSTRRAVGKDAPVVFEAGAMGNTATTMLSQNHRVLICSPQAEFLFAANEVLVKARDLVNGRTIYIAGHDCAVTYVHLLFDKHQIVTGDGLPSESYHPGDQSLVSFDNSTREEILRLMPDLIPDLEPGPSPAAGCGFRETARMILKTYEAAAMLEAMREQRGAPAHCALQ